jgi:MFS family permease
MKPLIGAAMGRSAPAVAALGITQIIGYGTLYYSFSILAPDMAREFGWSEQWVFGALSLSLLAGGLIAPTAGKIADRVGAARVMTVGSMGAALSLMLCALAPEKISFVLALLVMEIAASFVLYSTAFVTLVQQGGPDPQRRITHLTLIAGFASTLFWPLTSWMHTVLSWREIYLIFAALHVLVCLPIHWWLWRQPRHKGAHIDPELIAGDDVHGSRATTPHRAIFPLMLAGFAFEGFVLSSILIHMVPLMGALGLGTTGVVVSMVFGPAQVASRFINMIFGGGLSQRWLAMIAAGLLPMALSVLLFSYPLLSGAIVFAVLFGLGSGLASIVGGTLPLELFGRKGYGHRLGWVTAARQFTSAFAPFAFAWLMAASSPNIALAVLVGAGVCGLAAFGAIRFKAYLI